MLLRTNTLIFLYVLLFLFLGTLIYGTRGMKAADSLGDYLGNYNSEEELRILAEENKVSFEENKEEYESLGWDMEPLYYRMMVFDYAVKNGITQKAAVVFFESCPFTTRDSVGMMLTVNLIILMCMLFAACYLSVTMVARDFSGKQSRFLYSGNSRLSVLKDKIGAYLLSLTVIYLVLQLIGAVLGRLFATEIDTVLLLVNGEVTGMSFPMVQLLEGLGGILQLLPGVLSFFAVAALTRREEAAVITDVLLFLLIFLLAGDLGAEKENAVLTLVGTNPFYAVGYGYGSFGEWLKAYAAEILPTLVLGILGILSFRKAKIR